MSVTHPKKFNTERFFYTHLPFNLPHLHYSLFPTFYAKFLSDYDLLVGVALMEKLHVNNAVNNSNRIKYNLTFLYALVNFVRNIYYQNDFINYSKLLFFFF